MDEGSIAKWVVKYTNLERKKRRLKPLRTNKSLIYASREYSRLLCKIRKTGHYYDGTPADRAVRKGFSSYYVGENCAIVYARKREHPKVVAKKLVKLWMNSPGHRKNILHPDYNRIGVGISTRWNNRYRMYEVYAVQMFGYEASKLNVLLSPIMMFLLSILESAYAWLLLALIIAVLAFLLQNFLWLKI